ncbi:isochorismate lyase [Roseofilum casamattae]|uniref:Isochorismate lyase n=1 Tax=Roseofilum casamattae BLCC-M143 TaxID=3022442 RepID=A0ABT7BSW3_9CYAN|nr:isochorismate lyase [Roseofilum casamattae]MDJ1181581.1 isochorismate lyase [Roseofilum casamattae BLCC-M143]
MKNPDECTNITEIRTEIDRLDRQIIEILGQRFHYVKAAAQFKTSKTDVQASERFTAMLNQRRIWAEDTGLSPDAIEKMYRDLVEYFIAAEMKQWERTETE